jgi:hypothetical protein
MICIPVFVGFNRSVWHAFWLLPVSCLIYFVALWSVREHPSYAFDAKYKKDPPVDAGDFEPHSRRYQDLAKLVITLSTGVVAFLINSLANEKLPISPIVSKIEWSAPVIVGFFGLSIASLIGFMVSQTFWYEEYCHSTNRNSYLRWKYAACASLGWNGLLAFILGVGWLAASIFAPS